MIQPNIYNVRATVKDDWHTLKSLRLAALQDSPHAFIVTYADAIKFQDIEWQASAAQQTVCHYLLALKHGEAVGMVGTIIEEPNECHIVAMWIKPKYRGQGVATLLIDSVKTRIPKEGYSHWHYVLHLIINKQSDFMRSKVSRR